jgi:hypothetical protein
MKALVAHYSRGGTTKKVAEKISALLEGDIEEIHDLKKRSGIIGWFKSRASGGTRGEPFDEMELLCGKEPVATFRLLRKEVKGITTLRRPKNLSIR